MPAESPPASAGPRRHSLDDSTDALAHALVGNRDDEGSLAAPRAASPPTTPSTSAPARHDWTESSSPRARTSASSTPAGHNYAESCCTRTASRSSSLSAGGDFGDDDGNGTSEEVAIGLPVTAGGGVAALISPHGGTRSPSAPLYRDHNLRSRDLPVQRPATDLGGLESNRPRVCPPRRSSGAGTCRWTLSCSPAYCRQACSGARRYRFGARALAGQRYIRLCACRKSVAQDHQRM